MKTILIFIFAIATFNLSAQDSLSTINLDDVVVTGIKADKKTPVTQKTIAAANIDSVYQGEEMPIILGRTPSITSSSDGGHAQGYTYFRLRGIDQTRINMTLNGMPLNEPEDQGVYTSNYYGFMNNISSLQIQRGIGTSSNGVSSFAGSINFESENGLKRQLEAQVGAGSYGLRRAYVSYGTGMLKHNMAVFASLSLYAADGYKRNSGGTGYSGFFSVGHYGNKNIIKFTTFTGHAINQMAWLAVADSDIVKDRRTNYNTEGEYDMFTQSLYQLQYSRVISSKATLTSSIFYNYLEGNWDLNLASVGGGEGILNYQLKSHFVGAISNFSYTVNKLKLNVGVSGNYYKRKHAMGMYPDVETALYKNTGYKPEFSSFIKAAYDIGKFTLFFDIQYRYTSFRYAGDSTMNKLNWNFINPKGGVIYTVNNKLNFYVSAGQSHREPTRTALFGGNDDLIVLTPVKPESVIDFEAGTNYNKGGLSIQGNVYYMRFKNEITLQGALGSNGLPMMTNVTKSFRTGVELDLAYRVNKYFSLESNIVYSYNRITDNGAKFQPLYSPSVIANQSVKGEFKGFMVELVAKAQSKSYINFDNTLSTAPFCTLGVNASYTISHFTFMFQANNITNREYYTSGYAVGNERYLFVNAKANFYGTLKFRL